MSLRSDNRGFTLVELMITLTILAVVVAALMVVVAGSQRSKAATEALVEAQQSGRAVLDVIARDVRSAGYHVDEDAAPPQPAFAYVDSTELILYANLRPDTLGNSKPPDPTRPPLAPAPGGAPLPAKIAGAYAIPMKYRTGAEMIRYTLDLNNDGQITAADHNDPNAGEARRSPNPNDFVLIRQVYGDSSGSTPTPNNNGGAKEKIGLIRGPGGGTPHLFTVYFGSEPLPWDWKNGPVPANRLKDISRVVINITTESRRPDRKGNYVRSVLSTEVNSIRNVPEAGFTTYISDGYVFEDLNKNGVRDAGEPGLKNVVVRMGNTATDMTNHLGYYYMLVPPGVYVLKQEVPEGYGNLTPDTLTVNFVNNTSNFTHNFADTAKKGGWVLDTCWVDTNSNGIRDAGELRQDGVSITVNGVTKKTDGFGFAKFFVPPGSYSVSAMAPDSMVISTANPVSVTVNHGDTVRVDFGLSLAGMGTVSGKVYHDLNRNQLWDSGEPGMSNIWVGVLKSSSGETMGFATTDANGNYKVTVPNNWPAGTQPYEVTLQIPAGYFPTSPSTLAPIWVTTGADVPNKNFGLQNFQVITLNATRVLSLGSGELMEKDWNGNDDQYSAKSKKDVDLLLGSEWAASPNISVWFNDWNNTPLFSATPTYQRNAFSSALSMAVGPLDDQSPPERPDVVTGLEAYASGNIAVWITQNSSGNFGYLPTGPTYYQTLGGGDVNAVLITPLDGNASNDLVVGVRNGSNSGSIEGWLNSGTGTFTRNAAYPPSGGVTSMGEVRAMALGHFDSDSNIDLAVVTKTGINEGRLMLFEKRTSSPYYLLRVVHDISGEGNALAVLDVNGDGRTDVVVGTKTSDNSGKLQYWERNSSPFDFSKKKEVDAPGVVLSMIAADLGGGATRQDLAVGYRNNMTSFAGGVRVYFLDGGTLPATGSDPSGGLATSMIQALNVNHFNKGDNPPSSPPDLPDLAAAMKSGTTTGAVLIFVR